MPTFDEALAADNLPPLRAAGEIRTLQVNVGKLCNQACSHCHVDAGPNRTEIMTRETAGQVIEVVKRFAVPVFDLTGGAPELNPSFRWTVESAQNVGAHIIVRHNLTVQFADGMSDLPAFFAEHGVEVVASLPCYEAQNTDAQRGAGVFEKSIRALRNLNTAGYGEEGSGLILHLVYNPQGAVLPPDQTALEQDYKRELAARYGITFNRLYTITNMPISRFLHYLQRSGTYEGYMSSLVSAFNPATVEGLMCRTMVSVGWDGRLYDCDFNQMLETDVVQGRPQTLADLLERGMASLAGRPIVTGRHCFGCTAGAGSSCGGAVANSQ